MKIVFPILTFLTAIPSDAATQTFFGGVPGNPKNDMLIAMLFRVKEWSVDVDVVVSGSLTLDYQLTGVTEIDDIGFVQTADFDVSEAWTWTGGTTFSDIFSDNITWPDETGFVPGFDGTTISDSAPGNGLGLSYTSAP